MTDRTNTVPLALEVPKTSRAKRLSPVSPITGLVFVFTASMGMLSVFPPYDTLDVQSLNSLGIVNEDALGDAFARLFALGWAALFLSIAFNIWRQLRPR